MAEGYEFQSCDEVTPELIEAAFEPSTGPHPAQRVLRLLERMARVAKPKTGAHRILVVLAKLAQADWIHGGLQVTLSDFGVATEVDVRVDDGRMASRWRSFSVAVPLSELSQWVRQWPSAIRPLTPFGEPVADRLQLRAQAPGSSPAPSAEAAASAANPPVSTRRADVHRRQTARREDFEPPKEAFRGTDPSIPKPDSESQGSTSADSVPPVPVDDEGWD